MARMYGKSGRGGDRMRRTRSRTARHGSGRLGGWRRGVYAASAAALMLVGSGGAEYNPSARFEAIAADAIAAAEVMRQANFVTIAPKSEAELRARWEGYAERRRKIEETTPRAVRARAVVPPLVGGSPAAEASSMDIRAPLSVEAQLSQMAGEHTSGAWWVAYERYEIEKARSRQRN